MLADFWRRRKRLSVGLLVALAAAAAAIAYWTTGGSGTGTASTGDSTPVTVTQTSTVSGLVPGGAAQPLNFKITNPASTSQYVGTVTVSISSIKDSGGSTATGCTAADFTLVQPDPINSDLAAGDTAFAPSGASLAMKDTSSNQDGCKNVTVHLAYAVS